MGVGRLLIRRRRRGVVLALGRRSLITADGFDRAEVMTHHALREAIVETADLVLRPAVESFHWSEFARTDEACAAGRAAAEARVDDLRELAPRGRLPRRRA